jgi:hypothetical protein
MRPYTPRSGLIFLLVGGWISAPARHLLQAEPRRLSRRNPALVIGFHQRGQLRRRQFRRVQAKFIEPALHRLRPDGFEEDAIQLRHDFAGRASMSTLPPGA